MKKKMNHFDILQVCKYWNVLALDGSSWQKINLFDFQRDIEVCPLSPLRTFFNTESLIYSTVSFTGSGDWEYIAKMWRFSQITIVTWLSIGGRSVHQVNKIYRYMPVLSAKLEMEDKLLKLTKLNQIRVGLALKSKYRSRVKNL